MYQPLWYDHAEHGTAIRPADERYQAIRRHIDTHDLPVNTGLDFGAHGCYFALRLAEDYGARITAIDDDPFMDESYSVPIAGQVTVIRKQLGPTQIRKLGHFDIVLCLSVLHHLKQWRNYLDALTGLTPVLYVETAHPDEDLPLALAHHKSGHIIAELQHRNAEPLCHTPGYDARYQRTLWALTT